MARTLVSAEASAQARGPGLLPGQIFRSRPERARRLEEHAELLTRVRPLASAPQPRRLSVPDLGVLMLQHALLWQAAAFFPVSVFPLLFAPIWISPLFYFWAKPPSHGIFLISVSAWACNAALILMKHWARAFRVASGLALPFLRRQIFLPVLPCEGAASSVRLVIRYPRWRTPPLLILREESRLVPFPGWQRQDVFFSICLSMLLLSDSEIFLVLGTERHASGFARIHRAGFFLHHRPARGGDCRRLRQRRAQLRAKCESAPLRRTVTERATRSTPNAFGV